MIEPEKALRLRNQLAKHRSTGDWDFSNTNWQLNSSVYTSAPSSLQFLSDNVFTDVLIKTAVVPIANVKEGRVITEIRFTDEKSNEAIVRILFRYQDADNYYCVDLVGVNVNYVTVSITRRYATVETTLAGGVNQSWASNVFKRVRVTWWNDYVGLVIRVEYWSGSEWVLWYDAYDANNYWKDVGGRVGIRARRGYYLGYKAIYIDDTYIYGIG